MNVKTRHAPPWIWIVLISAVIAAFLDWVSQTHRAGPLFGGSLRWVGPVSNAEQSFLIISENMASNSIYSEHRAAGGMLILGGIHGRNDRARLPDASSAVLVYGDIVDEGSGGTVVQGSGNIFGKYSSAAFVLGKSVVTSVEDAGGFYVAGDLNGAYGAYFLNIRGDVTNRAGSGGTAAVLFSGNNLMGYHGVTTLPQPEGGSVYGDSMAAGWYQHGRIVQDGIYYGPPTNGAGTDESVVRTPGAFGLYFRGGVQSLGGTNASGLYFGEVSSYTNNGNHGGNVYGVNINSMTNQTSGQAVGLRIGPISAGDGRKFAIYDESGAPSLLGVIHGDGRGLTNLPNSVIASGTATLAHGTNRVLTAAAHPTNRFSLTYRSLDGNASSLAFRNIEEHAAFTIVSGLTSDTNQVDWIIIKP